MLRLTPILLALALLGCSSDPPDTSDPDADADADAGVDVGRDLATTPEFGLDVETGPATCELQADCDVGEACLDDTCQAVSGCSGVNDWRTCVRAFEAAGPEYALRAMCGYDGYCRIACLEDGECGDGETCTDYGYCREFTGDLSAPPPGGAAERRTLAAGASNVRMRFPIGISMAGYGSRAELSAGRYADQISDSVGHFHALYARAIWLDNGERELIIVRLPIIFASAWLHEAVARRLQEETGENWRDSLVISTTHTHSGPARFWPVADDAALDVGRLGSDSYSHVAFEWIVDSAVEAALAARPAGGAAVGWTIVEAFDTDDAIASDRWGETPPFDDNRLLMIRVDDINGVPIAALISLGMHSTYNDSDYLTGDAAGTLERQLEVELARRYGRFVPVMFISENSGTMSPRGGHRGHESLHKHEFLGFEFARRVSDDFDAIATTGDVEFESRTHFFPITYERVGYEVGEWARGNAGTYQSTFFHGAIQCLANTDDDPATHADPYSYFCLPVHIMSQNRPASIFGRSMITALQIDGLSVVTLPGESSMEVGWQVLREARDRLGIDPANAFVWGYAQDHQLYITPTNLRGELPSFPGISTPMAPDDYPDYAFSWLQGGYEPSLSVWGHLFGDFMVERAVEAMALLDDPTMPADTVLPAQYTPFTTDAFEIEPSPAAEVGTIVEDVPATVARLQQIELAWVGGDPGVEMPQAPLVTLERDDGDGNFESFDHANMRPYDNREPVMITRVRRNADRWEWVVYWEERKSFPAGDYRFRVNGHHDVDGTGTAYELFSREFTVGGAPIEITASAAGGTLTGTLAYPAAPEFEIVGDDPDPGEVIGSYRMRHPDVPTGQPDPVEADDVSQLTIEVFDATGLTLLDTIELAEISVTTTTTGVPVTTFEADVSSAPADATFRVDVTDRWGNTGSSP